MDKPVMRTQLFHSCTVSTSPSLHRLHTHWSPARAIKLTQHGLWAQKGDSSNAGHQQRACLAKFKSSLRCEVPLEPREATMLQILHIMLTKGSSRTGLHQFFQPSIWSLTLQKISHYLLVLREASLFFSFTFSIYSENFPSSLIPPACTIIQVIKNCRSLTQFCIFITFGRKSAAIILF